MIITYHGKQLVKLQVGDMVCAINPYKGGKDKAPKFGADIVLSSIPNDEYGAIENMSYGTKVPFSVDGAGEFEVGGVYIKGVATNIGKEELSKGDVVNTAFSLYIDGINVCHLGAHDSKELSSNVKETLGEIDILFVPIGGDDTVDASTAAKLATSLEARVVIPVGMSDDKKGAESIKQFVKEFGKEKVESVAKLTVKKKDVDAKEGDVVVLERQ